MIEALRNAVRFGELSLPDAVRMATEVPAKLLGISRSRGMLAAGQRADLVAFDSRFKVLLTIVGGRTAYERLQH
jgi:N-acetylglucosamine-6-phosphate deacetylase